MHSKSTILTFGLLASTVLSSPTENSQGSGFSVTARRVESLQRRAGQASSAATRHVVVDFTFGGQPIPVALDSGSSFTYVASTLDEDETETSSLPALFNPNTSRTYHDENDPEDAYDCGGQSTVCVMGLDDVATAGLTAKQMAFGVTSKLEPGTFSSGQAATMGFGRQNGDPTGWLPRDQTFWYRVGADLPMPYLFAVDIYGDRNGTFDFGFIDQKKYKGAITYAKMDTSRTNWNFNMTGFAIGNQQMQAATEFTGVVDTGGPNIGLPAEIVNAYFNTFGGTPSPGNSHNYPCKNYPPPDLTLQIAGGGKLVLNGTFLVDPPDGSGSETCSGRLDDSQQTAYNIGASVLDQKFVIFDHVGQRIGFADKASFSDSDTSQTSDIASDTASMIASASLSTHTASTTAVTTATVTAAAQSTSSANGAMVLPGPGIRDFTSYIALLMSLFI